MLLDDHPRWLERWRVLLLLSIIVALSLYMLYYILFYRPRTPAAFWFLPGSSNWPRSAYVSYCKRMNIEELIQDLNQQAAVPRGSLVDAVCQCRNARSVREGWTLLHWFQLCATFLHAPMRPPRTDVEESLATLNKYKRICILLDPKLQEFICCSNKTTELLISLFHSAAPLDCQTVACSQIVTSIDHVPPQYLQEHLAALVDALQPQAKIAVEYSTVTKYTGPILRFIMHAKQYDPSITNALLTTNHAVTSAFKALKCTVHTMVDLSIEEARVTVAQATPLSAWKTSLLVERNFKRMLLIAVKNA